MARLTERTPGRLLPVAGTVLMGLLFATAGPVRGQAVKTDTSLSFIPDDAAFFTSSLRNKEQVDLFLKSNAFKSLQNLPLVKMAYAQFEAKSKGDDGLKKFHQFMAVPDNKALVEVLVQAGSEEIFVYGGKAWTDLFKVLGEVNNAQSFAPLKALIENNDPSKAQIRAILLALQSKRGLVKIPELVIGFKVKDTKKAGAQVKRLEKILGGLEELVPILKGKVNAKQVAGGNFLAFEADGSLIPWDNINLKDYEDKADEFEDLLKHFKKMTLAVTLGVKGDYLLLGISSTTKDLEKLDAKHPSLAEREEFKPLAKYAKERLTGLGYVSKAFLQGATAVNTNYAELGKNLKEMLDKAPNLKEERKTAIAKDIDGLMADLKKTVPTYGAMMSFSFMTDTGYEGYSYDATKYPHLEGATLTLHRHFGGDPILGAAFAFKADGSAYKTTVKWLKTIYGHAEAVFLEMVPEEAKEPYEKFTKAVFPILKKIDENTTKKFFPSLKDSGLGIVIDGKWSSKRWFKELPETPRAMPLPQLGLLIGLSDAKLFEDALKSYRTLINDLIQAGRGATPMPDNIPDFKIIAPEREEGKNGLLFYYNLPEELGIDKQVLPVAGIGKSSSVLAMSKEHAERLMASTPLKIRSKPLARKGDLLGVSVLNWPALVNLAQPWIELGVRQALKDPGAKGMDPDSVLAQVKVALAVLKTFKHGSSATYLEGGKRVTHGEITLKDLARVAHVPDQPKKAEPKDDEKDKEREKEKAEKDRADKEKEEKEKKDKE